MTKRLCNFYSCPAWHSIGIVVDQGVKVMLVVWRKPIKKRSKRTHDTNFMRHEQPVTVTQSDVMNIPGVAEDGICC